MNQTKKKIIGLTGGIATGKSTVASYLRDKYSLPVFDADIIAREAVQVNSPILAKIVTRYGNEILNQDGSLNRAKLGQIIFNHDREKQWLESQIHPFVYDYFQGVIEETKAPVIVFVIPLLWEANMTDLVTETWVVYCSLEQEIDRLMKRNHLTTDEAQARINSQMPLSEKVKLADVVINNQGDLSELYTQIDQIMSSRINKN